MREKGGGTWVVGNKKKKRRKKKEREKNVKGRYFGSCEKNK
jgi:hypothetical protein